MAGTISSAAQLSSVQNADYYWNGMLNLDFFIVHKSGEGDVWPGDGLAMLFTGH